MLKDDINVPLLSTIAAVSACLLLTVLIGVHAWYLWQVDGETQFKWQGVTYRRVYELKAAQKLDIESPPKWSDRDKGTVKIPIQDAMEMVAQNGGKVPGR